jgi:SpoVK/Ycf46/Vps4 family AAA+-type ATPase
MARHVIPAYGWQDIVLPIDQMAQLRELCNQSRFRHVVYDAWGVGRHHQLGAGLNALFSGPSGTGKTMAAEVIAAELELDLYTVDISQMVSKYIGETEKNLDRVFTAARDSNAILFFDEADAIFGKRSPVRDAHDRYANIEVGYLLQKMEQHDGIVILGTNLRTNMDDAFIRRLHHAVEFPFPDELLRLPIWHKHLAPGIPRDDDIDLAFLARQFEVAGGNIRNIVVNGCFLAAADDAPLAMRHLILATRREFQKMGRVCDEETFGPYFALIAGPANDGGAA